MAKGGKPPAAPDYNAVAKTQGDQNLAAIRAGAALNRVDQTNPYGSTTYKNLGGDQWQQTTQLSPDQQAILDLQEKNQQAQGQAAGSSLGQAQSAISSPLNFGTAPSRVTSVATNPVPQVSDAGRMQAQDAIYKRQTAMLDPQFAQSEEKERSRLINSGNAEGSEGFTNAMDNFARQKQAAYGSARNDAITGGDQAYSQQLADALRVNDNQFQQGVTNAGLTNDARTNAINEMLTQRSVPLQEFLQLNNGAPSPGASSPSIPNVGSPQAGDYQGAAGANYNAQSDLYNFNQQRNSQNTNSALNLAALAAMMYGGG
jgi:hypothetical protein